MKAAIVLSIGSMAGRFDEVYEGVGASLQRAIVLHLLERPSERRSCLELHSALAGGAVLELEAALSDLEQEGVVELSGSEVRASRATQRLDALNLIGI